MSFTSKEYKVSEGNQIGYLPTGFDANGAIVEKKIIASSAILKGQVVELTDELKVAPTSVASSRVLGVAMFDAKINEPTVIETNGLFKLTASEAITAPAEVESAIDGKVANKNATPASVVKVIGIALTDASGDGADVYVLMK